MERQPSTHARPAWKEPMVWLVAAIPAASVLASVALLAAAARSSGNDDAVADRVQRTAQIQMADLGPDLAARRLGLAARLSVKGDHLELTPATGTFPRDAELRLSLHHPARADADLELTMLPAGDRWRLRHALAHDHDWKLSLAPADGRWRLQGRLPRGGRSAELGPALPAR